MPEEEEFSLRDAFSPSAARPEHPDFWKLSEIVLSLDAAMTERPSGTNPDDVIAEQAAKIGDSYSVCYMAVQRAMRLHGARTLGDLRRMADEIGATALAYMEGMIVGARFTAER